MENGKDRMNRTLTTRPLAVGLLALSLLAGTGAATAAAVGDPSPREAEKAAAPALPSLTAAAGRTTVKQWQEFRVTGRTTAVLPGNSVTLQQKQGTRWVSLPARTKVKLDGSYALRVKLGIKGENHLRVATAGTMSKVFLVTVR